MSFVGPEGVGFACRRSRRRQQEFHGTVQVPRTNGLARVVIHSGGKGFISGCPNFMWPGLGETVLHTSLCNGDYPRHTIRVVELAYPRL